jgi:hypothetical protein
MTATARKALIVAAIHVAIVSSLGAKLLVDRATRPRVWARTAPVDPSLPIRGRYVRMRVEAALGPDVPNELLRWVRVTLSERDGRLVASSAGDDGLDARVIDHSGERVVAINEPVAFFIPEHAVDPARRAPDEELWVEVTLPRGGAPRPIRLGVKKSGAIAPLDLR